MGVVANMRRALAYKKGVRTGDIVRISASLKSGVPFARLFVYSKYNGVGDFSPHVPESQIGTGLDGMPIMAQPTMMRLTRKNGERTIEIRAYDNLEVQVFEEYDAGDDPAAKVRIYRYGKIAQAVRRIFRNTIGAIRRHSGSPVRPNH